MPGMKNTMREFGAGQLHSGSKTGPVVKNRKQAIAIGLSEQRQAGVPTPAPKPRRESVPGMMATRNHLNAIRRSTLPKKGC